MKEIENKRNLYWFGLLSLVHSSRIPREFPILILILGQDPVSTPLDENLVKTPQNPRLSFLTIGKAYTFDKKKDYNSKLFLFLPNTQLSKWIYCG